MDTRRLILLVIFSFSLLMLWQSWLETHRPAPVASAVEAQQATQAHGVPAPAPTPPATASVPATAAASASSVPEDKQAEVSAVARAMIHVHTNVLDAEIDPLGGTLTELTLTEHHADDSTAPFALLGAEHHYVAQSGLIGADLPTHHTLYQAAATRYTLADGQDTLKVALTARTAEGVQVTKTLTFRRGSYLIDIGYEIANESAVPLTGAHAYYQLTRDGETPKGDPMMSRTFTGAGVYTEQDKYVKVSFSEMKDGKKPYTAQTDNGWVGMVQHYFVSAFIPTEHSPREYYTRALGPDLYSAGVIVPVPPVAPGAKAVVDVPLYAGPQDRNTMHSLAPGLELVVDYGWFKVIAEPLFWVLKVLHGWLGNWGLAIIALTVLIKAVFFPLSAASYKSMARMRLIAPRMQRLKEQYGKDRARMNQAMMELYKTEKINPLGGCLPVVVQIPVFIALYWVLLSSVELRNAPFYGWIHDLSAQDPFYILPALMMVSMFLQTRLNPTPPDPMQAKLMLIMPLVFGVMFFFFPAGLVLYWLVNNILSIAQQWQITRLIERGKGDAHASAKH